MGFMVGKRHGSIKRQDKDPRSQENMNRVVRMRRTEVACAECRRRKLKCEGTRPSCSRCESFHLECYYAPPPRRISRLARRGQ
ncbi:Zn(II)2Cys6 transcription factor domain-containing protein [Aspergillus stella-maris]|uniref:Zn(II)2Cys6 transcription factor domain-containing protein n=1 Tax=Aspergillus stella-maris TaxID=1810926 RepID=UPI003CCD8F56